MKAEDLMIGDFVKHSESDIVGKVIMINTNPDGVHYHGKSITIQNGQVLCSGNENLFEPIPITEEILEEMGFKMMAGGSFFRIGEEIGRYYAYVYDIVTKSLTIDGGFIPAKFCYVHELQHALNMCNIPYTIVL